ncbi:MAG: hypothetical protein HYZ45_13110 [Burkholderiales bacterium]|nr:hypothetical protein [Burkholderiales bacterium]
MDTFSEVYQKSVEVLKTQSLDDSWKKIESNLKMMLKPDGPDAGQARSLDELRDYLHEIGKGGGATASAQAEAMLKAANVGTPGFQERAAFLKTMQHFYLVEKKGNQSVWVMDPPKNLTAWPYDQFAGKTKEGIKTDLMLAVEIFGDANRQMMSDSLQLARKWSMEVQIKLAAAEPSTLEIVKRWFHAGGDDEQKVLATTATLLTGFKKITNACNSTNVTFSDLPHLRDDFDGDGTFAAVAEGETRPVIYLFKEFLKLGSPNKMGVIPKLWLCALTVVHELTHSLLQTEDIKYDHQGLNVRPGFSHKDALNNAESWAYLAADLVGAVSEADRKKALRQ